MTAPAESVFPAALILPLLAVSRWCVRNELQRTERLIVDMEKLQPGRTPAHLNPARYLAALTDEANRLRATLGEIEAILGLDTSGI